MRASNIAAVLALIALLWLSVSPLVAEDEPPEATWEGSLSVGVQVLEGDRDSSKFEEYRDVPSGPWLDFLGIERNEEKTGRYIIFETIRPGLKDARATLRVGEYGTYEAEIYWDKLPHLLVTNGRTIFQRASDGSFVLPDVVQAELRTISTTDIDPDTRGTQIDTAAFGAIINDLARPTPLQVSRETLAASYRRDVNGKSSYSASISNERRTGAMPMGTTMRFTNQVELAAPVDYRTRDVNADYEYRRGGDAVRLGYWGSYFENENSALRWENPISLADARDRPAVGQLALPPSNRSHTLSLTGGFAVGRTTRVTAALSGSRWTQNEALLPHTLNTALGSPELPAATLDGLVKTSLAEVVLTSRPADGVSLTARYRQRTLRNRTPQIFFEDYVIADSRLASAEGEEGIETHPHSFRTRSASIDAGWDLSSRLSMKVGAERETWHRVHREVRRTDEDIVRASLDYRHSGALLARLSLSRSQRDIEGDYDGGEVESPLLRRFDEADRDRDSVGFLLDYSPCERWNTVLAVNLADNDYENSVLGLQDSRSRDVSLDFAYAVDSMSSVFGGVSLERFRYNMDSRFRDVDDDDVPIDDPLNDWSHLSKDTVRTYWLGWNRVAIPGKLNCDVSLSFTDGKGVLEGVGVPGGEPDSEPIPLPTVRYKYAVLGTGVNRKVGNERWVRLGYRYEKYDETDFATDIMQPYMGIIDAANSGTSVYLGASQPDYHAHFFTVSLQQKF